MQNIVMRKENCNNMKSLKIKKAEILSEIIDAFDPSPLSEMNLSEFYYDNTMFIRTGHEHSSPLNKLFTYCTMSSRTKAHLLIGHGGCGKSTELFNLERRFKKVGHPVHIYRTDLEVNLFLAECWDIMLLITEGLCNVAKENGINIPDKILREVFDYMNKDMEEIDVVESSASLDMGVMLTLFASIKSNLKLGTQTRSIIKEKIEKRGSEWMRYIREISDRITDEMEGRRPILIFEGFDRLQPPERAFEIFRNDILSQMPFPIIYTFPISLTYDSPYTALESFYEVHFLPMIKVSNADKSQNDQGIEVMHNIVKLRADLKLFDENALIELIKRTGGVLRHLFDCITEASLLAMWRGGDKIEMSDAQRALADLSSTLTKRISERDNDMLVRIFDNLNDRTGIRDRESLLRQMQALVVLEYQNGERWHDLHPLIAEFLVKQGVINDES